MARKSYTQCEKRAMHALRLKLVNASEMQAGFFMSTLASVTKLAQRREERRAVRMMKEGGAL